LVPPGDENELADGIMKLLREKDRIRKFSVRAENVLICILDEKDCDLYIVSDRIKHIAHFHIRGSKDFVATSSGHTKEEVTLLGKDIRYIRMQVPEWIRKGNRGISPGIIIILIL